MRLIDADECPCVSCEDTRNAHCTYEHRSCKKFCDWLNTTIYDIDKVVEELEKYSYETEIEEPILGETNVTESFEEEVVALYQAIKIVKSGGKNDR